MQIYTKGGKIFYIVMSYYSRPLWSFFILERSFDKGMGNNKVVYQVRCPECGDVVDLINYQNTDLLACL